MYSIQFIKYVYDTKMPKRKYNNRPPIIVQNLDAPEGRTVKDSRQINFTKNTTITLHKTVANDLK